MQGALGPRSERRFDNLHLSPVGVESRVQKVSLDWRTFFMRRWLMPLIALLVVACQQASQESQSALEDSTAPGARYTIIHAGATW